MEVYTTHTIVLDLSVERVLDKIINAIQGVPAARLQERLGRLEDLLKSILENQMSQKHTLQEYEDKLNIINANTNASSIAAASMAQSLAAVRVSLAAALAELNQARTEVGLPAVDADALLSELDGAVTTSAALKTFLESTGSTPPTEPEPDPIVHDNPPPLDPGTGGPISTDVPPTDDGSAGSPAPAPPELG
jgi:chromosome segregation ATPase